MQEILSAIFDVSSIWSVIARGLVWLAISIVIIISMDSPKAYHTNAQLKSNLGFFIFFLTLSTAVVYFLFGYQPA